MINVSSETLNILKRINSAGYEAFIVGGFVRDALLDIQSYDIDICTNSPYLTLVELFSDKTLITHEPFGSIAFKEGEMSYELTHYRTESDYLDKRHPSSVVLVDSMIQDVFRRDFTMNALLYHPEKGIIDLVGGLDDLEKRQLKTVCKPDFKFSEDPLRIVRLFRFMSQFNFSVEPETLEAAYRQIHHLNHYKKQWVKTELFKLIQGPFFLETMQLYPLCISTLIPELGRARTFSQDNPFHKFNLFEHTLHVIQGVESLDLKLVALFHDLGKLNTRVLVENRSRFPGHAEASCEIAKDYLEGWHLESKRRKFILNLIAMHDTDLGDSLQEIARFVAQFGYDFTRNLVTFKISDNAAKSEKAHYQLKRCENYQSYLTRIEEIGVFSVKDLKISGSDLINLNVETQQRKHVLNHCLEKVIAEEIENTHASLIEEVWRVQNGIY